MMIKKNRRTTHVRWRRAAAAVTGVMLALAIVAPAPSAYAAVPIVKAGDILVTDFGDVVNPASVDKIDIANQTSHRVTSFGVLGATDHLAGAPNGDFFVSDITGTITKVDHVTGAHTIVRHGFADNFPISDLAVAADGNLLALLREETGVALVRVNLANGSLTELSDDGLFDFPSSLAIEFDGRVMITDGSDLLRVNPNTGEQSRIAVLPSNAVAVAIRRDGQIFVRTVAHGTTLAEVLQIDPVTAKRTNVARGGFLDAFGSRGLAFEDDTHLVSAEDEIDDTPDVVRIDTRTGAQTRLAELGNTEDQDIMVAGVNQIPPSPAADRQPQRVRDAHHRRSAQRK